MHGGNLFASALGAQRKWIQVITEAHFAVNSNWVNGAQIIKDIRIAEANIHPGVKVQPIKDN